MRILKKRCSTLNLQVMAYLIVNPAKELIVGCGLRLMTSLEVSERIKDRHQALVKWAFEDNQVK